MATTPFLRCLKSKTLSISNPGEAVKQQEHTAGRNAEWQTTLGDHWAVASKLNIFSTDDPAIALLGSYSSELSTYVHTKTCTLKFITTLFIISKNWK